ncbi:MAG: hypothetical protein QN187_14530 [Armatimonadota bacterium]|nr:hypothetical protein [Armatimonadota bacterium]MDR7519183.1 hypothetical protein [Armatimonadota bacterium]MDR7550992.1 hypothetical protein [Armatimonadota bacterium]
MTDAKIEILETGIHVHALEVRNRDVAEYLRPLLEEQREQALVHAIEVGVFCLERARAGQDLDFVRRQVESLLDSVQRAVEKIPEETQKQLTAKIGTGEGQVLAPIQVLVNGVSTAASEKIEDIRKLLQEEVDPGKETSSLGKALRALRDLLDPKRTDSVQGALDIAVKQVTAESGPLAKAVRDVVAEALKPLEEQVKDLTKEVRGQEAAAEALEQTTLKGAPYEEEVVGVLQAWAQGLGAEVHHVGTDNRPGDVVVVVQSDARDVSLRIVTEARDRQDPVGRKVISDTVNDAMAERSANSAIYVSRNRTGFAKEIGEWAEGTSEAGRWIACTHEHLVTAVRFLIVQERLQQLRAATPSVDASSIESQIQRIRTTLGRIKTINTKVTDVRSSAEEIQREAETIRDEVKSALTEIEDALRVAAKVSTP